jgi:hypothetical protein
MNWINRVGGCAFGSLLLVISPAFIQTLAGEDAPSTPAIQPTAAKAASPPTCHCIGEEDSSTAVKIRAVLASPLKSTGLEFTGTPLEQVVNQLQDEYGIPIQFDLPALEDAGRNPQEAVTVDVHNISLRSALALLLKPHHLTYVIQNEVLTITTPEQAETLLVTCVYDVRDLPSGRGDDINSLVNAIISCIASESWAENGGGQAQIRPLKPGVLVISQTQEVHEQIGNFLDALRQVK